MEITIKLPVDSKKGKKKLIEEDEMYPGALSPDDVLAVPASMQINFYDLGTYKENDEWKELEDFFRNDEAYELEEENREINLNRAIYQLRKQTDYYNFIKNKYDKDPDYVEAEFGPDNDNQLERKPLKPIIVLSDDTVPPQIKERDDFYRWDGVSVDKPLMHVSLIKDQDGQDEEGDVARWVNQDCAFDNLLDFVYAEGIPEEKHNSTRRSGSDTELGYIIKNIWFRKAHLKIQEFGSHSTCVTCGSTWYNDDSFYDGTQIVDMVEGIFWNNFNTYRNIDRNNSEKLFKITKSARYDADAFTDPILRFSPAKTTKVEVYLMPRDWLFYAHFASYGAIEEIGEGFNNSIGARTYTEISDGKTVVIAREGYCYYDVGRSDIQNYHNIFCIWDRPPYDFALPRRRDENIIDYGEGRIGEAIPASFLMCVKDNSFYFIEDGEWTKYPCNYYSLDPAMFSGTPSFNDLKIYWNQLMDDGGTYTETHVGDNDYTWTTETIGITESYNFQYTWADLSFVFENVKEPTDSIIKCKSSINSLYLYNFIGPLFADGYHGTSFYFNAEETSDLINIDGSVGMPWTEYMRLQPGKTLIDFREVAMHSYGWQSPIWFATSDGCVPCRSTVPWISKGLGAYVNTWQWAGEISSQVNLHNLGRINRERNVSYYETFHWCYTPPNGGPFNFGSDFEILPAGRCSPDNNELTYIQIDSGVGHHPDKDITFYYPAYVELDRPLYNAADKYDEDECLNFDKIWDKIWNNKIVQDRIANLDQGTYPADNVPYITAVAPTKAEKLVALVKVDSTIYYIWREKDEGVGEPIKQLPANSSSFLGSMDEPDDIQRSFPLYGCLEIWDDSRQIGHIQTLDWKYLSEYRDTDTSVCRTFDSIVCPTVEWYPESHETFSGLKIGDHYFPWFYTGVEKEHPIVDKEEIFELEQGALIMTYRQRARFDSGYQASFVANCNLSNPSDNSFTAITADLRNRDRIE